MNDPGYKKDSCGMDNAGIFKKAPKYCQMYCIIFPPFALFTQAALLSAKLIPA